MKGAYFALILVTGLAIVTSLVCAILPSRGGEEEDTDAQIRYQRYINARTNEERAGRLIPVFFILILLTLIIGTSVDGFDRLGETWLSVLSAFFVAALVVPLHTWASVAAWHYRHLTLEQMVTQRRRLMEGGPEKV